MNGRDATGVLNASLLLDGEDRILEGNRDAEVFLERPLEEVRKTPLYKANPSLYSALKELLAKSKRGRGVEDYALAYKVAKRLMRLNINMSPYPLEALGTTGTLITITSVGMRPPPERREAVKEAPAPPAAPEAPGLPQLLDSLAEPAFILDLEANFTYVNPAMSSLLGRSGEEIVGRPLSFFMQREEAKKSLDHLVEAASAAPWRGELEFNRGDGTSSFILVTVDALRGKRGKVGALLGMGREYTAEARIRREREDELRRVWSMLENVGLALVCFTPDHRVTLLSHSAGELLGTTGDRAIGTPLPELFPAAAREEVVSLLERAVRGEEAGEVEVEAGKKKQKRPLTVSVRPAVTANGRTREYMAVLEEAAREPSERERAEALLKVSAWRERVLALAVREREPEGFLACCLELMQAELGCAAGAAFTLEGGEAVLRAQRGLDEGGEKALSRLRLRAGHVRVCASLRRLSLEMHAGVPRKGWDEVSSLVERADALLPLLREGRWRNVLVFPLRREGEAVGALALADCHPDQLARVDDQALAAVGGAVAAALSGMAARKEGDSPRPPANGGGDAAPAVGAAAAEDAQGAKDASGERGECGGGVIPTLARAREREHDYFEIAREAKGGESAPDNLTLWSEPARGKPIPAARGIDLPALLQDLREYYSRRGRGEELFLEIEEDLPGLYADKRMLREALMRILDNALRYSPPGAPVILGAERWGDEILLRVEDQGPGIPVPVVEEVMRRGTGRAGPDKRARAGASGLFLCRELVAAMGGDLSIKGRPGEGTTVFIRLRLLPFVGEGT